MAFREADNRVKVEGILAETDLKYNSFVSKTTGEPVESIGGSIKVLVEQEINGESVSLEVPVYMFSTKMTKAGKINPAYESIEKVMKEFVSIAACGSKEQADKIRITNGKIKMNEFIGQNGQVVSQPRVSANFVSKAVGDFKPEARFDLEFMVSKIAPAVDKDGVELDPERLNIEVIVPQYTAPSASTMSVDLVKLVVTNPAAISAIKDNWEAGSCYKAGGRLNFTSRTETTIEESGFGEPVERTRTINTSELVVTRGSEAPLEGDFAYDIEDIKAGMAARSQKLEDMKSGKVSTAKQTPAPSTSKGKQDLGF